MFTEEKARRYERRRRSRVVAARRLLEHLRNGGHDIEPLSWLYPKCGCRCPGEKSVYYYSKRSVACNCSKRRHGSPRLTSGMCNPDARQRIYKWRKTSRELNRLVCSQYADLEGEEVAVLS